MRDAVGKGKANRINSQTFLNFVDLIPPFLQEPLLEKENGPTLKQELLFAWLCKLGLRNACAFTEKMMSS